MTVFVAHEQTDASTIRSQKIVLQLQYENPAHCFIPASIAFEHLYNGDFSQDDIFDIEADLLMNCDQLLIVSKISPNYSARNRLCKDGWYGGDRP